jgi:acetyl esterase/lipase
MSSAPGPVAPLIDARAVPGASPKVVRNVVYTTRGGVSESLDVYLPRGTAPPGGWPVVLAIHGGGWRRLDRSEYAGKVAPTLLAARFAVVAPDYFLSTPGSPSWPLVYDDLRDVVRWVHGPGAELGLNPAQIGAMGESAGAHLALMLGTETDPSTRVRAVVDFFGPTDLAAMVNDRSMGASAVVQLLGASPGQDPAEYVAASPVDRVTPRSAPVLILQGTADTTVPPSQSQELAAAGTAAGVPNRLMMIPGATHGFGLRVGRLDLVPDVVSFLHAYLS